MNEEAAREEICRIGALMYERGLVGGTEGNVSFRLADGNVLASPTGVSKGTIKSSDVALLTCSGDPLCEKKASSEIALHLRIYRDKPEVRAVVHAHPIVATGHALAGKTIARGVLPEADVLLGPVLLVPFAVPGTTAMGDAIAPFLVGANCFLLQSHGAVTLGNTLEQAYTRMETLERVARVFLVANLLGGARPLPPEGVRWLAEF